MIKAVSRMLERSNRNALQLHQCRMRARLQPFPLSLWLRFATALPRSTSRRTGSSRTERSPEPPRAGAVDGVRTGPARMPQGGRGPIKVLVITKGHEFEREPFFTIRCLARRHRRGLTWSNLAADKLMNPTDAKDYDVYLFYDLGGPGVATTKPDGTRERVYPEPSPQLKEDFEAMVKAGKGMVFLHHAAAAWAHHWPEYSEVIGGACDWYAPVTVRGIVDPGHGFYGNTKQQHVAGRATASTGTDAVHSRPSRRTCPSPAGAKSTALPISPRSSIRPIEKQQSFRLVQGVGKQPGRLHPDRTRSSAMGTPRHRHTLVTNAIK